MEEKLSREERFKRAKEARERANKERASGDWGPVEIPEFECAVLKPNMCHVIRLLGNSLEMADKPTDPVMVERSFIKGDDGKFFGYIWSDDPDHPVRAFMRTILGKYKWDKENRCRIYDNAKIPVFQRWMTNGIEGKRLNNGAMPQKYILFNCIDRGDNWCKEHKHSKLLCWDISEKEVNGEKKEYPVYGVKPSLYKSIFDVKCTELGVHFEDTDFVIRRYTEKTSPDNKTYLVVYSPEEKSAIRNMGEKDGVDYLSKVSSEYLEKTGEDKYELYNLKDVPFVSAPTPTSVFLAKLSKYIKEVDSVFGTHHYDDIVLQKEKEIELLKQKKASEDASAEAENDKPEHEPEIQEKVEVREEVVSDSVEDEELPTEVEDKEEETAPVVAKKKKVAQSEFKITPELLDLFPALEEMSEDELKLITGFDSVTGELKFAEGIELAECPTCGETIPDAWKICICGQRFE